MLSVAVERPHNSASRQLAGILIIKVVKRERLFIKKGSPTVCFGRLFKFSAAASEFLYGRLPSIIVIILGNSI